MVRRCRRGTRLALPFLRAALRYWLRAWPLAAREVRRLQAQAQAIPDARLRSAALRNLRDERGNLEGAAAFALLAPRSRRASLIRALVSFQAIYDYVDSLGEQTDYAAPETHRGLHQALHDALDHQADPACSRYATTERDGYLIALVLTCQRTVAALPSTATVLPHALAAIERMIEYQLHNHLDKPAAAEALTAWADAAMPSTPDYAWWETAAAGASSLVVFALLALATHDEIGEAEASMVVVAYLSVGALHVLLDSFVDRAADAVSGDHSLVSHYPSACAQADRLATIAAEARLRTRQLRDGTTHSLLLTAMATFYLAAPIPDDATRQTIERVTAALGPPARAAFAVHRARRAAACLRWPRRPVSDRLPDQFYTTT